LYVNDDDDDNNNNNMMMIMMTMMLFFTAVGFPPVAVVSKLVQKWEKDSYIRKEK
jgi:hypothetical protein